MCRSHFRHFTVQCMFLTSHNSCQSIDLHQSCYKTFSRPLLSSVSSRTRTFWEEKGREKKRTCFSSWPTTVPSSAVWKRWERVMEMKQSSPPSPLFVVIFFYFQTLFISCASFLFAVDKQHQQMHGHGCTDANLLSLPKKRAHPNFTKHTQSQRVHPQILVNSFMLLWENADFFFLLNQVLLGEFKPTFDLRFSEDSVHVTKLQISYFTENHFCLILEENNLIFNIKTLCTLDQKCFDEKFSCSYFQWNYSVIRGNKRVRGAVGSTSAANPPKTKVTAWILNLKM